MADGLQGFAGFVGESHMRYDSTADSYILAEGWKNRAPIMNRSPTK
jgi:hypothetical protein